MYSVEERIGRDSAIAAGLDRNDPRGHPRDGDRVHPQRVAPVTNGARSRAGHFRSVRSRVADAKAYRTAENRRSSYERRRLFAGRVKCLSDPAAAVDYLSPPNTALRGHAPFRLVDTDIGTESVVATLGRIEHEVSDWSESDGRKIRESMLPSHNTHLHLAEDSMLCDSSLVSSKDQPTG